MVDLLLEHVLLLAVHIVLLLMVSQRTFPAIVDVIVRQRRPESVHRDQSSSFSQQRHPGAASGRHDVPSVSSMAAPEPMAVRLVHVAVAVRKKWLADGRLRRARR